MAGLQSSKEVQKDLVGFSWIDHSHSVVFDYSTELIVTENRSSLFSDVYVLLAKGQHLRVRPFKIFVSIKMTFFVHKDIVTDRRFVSLGRIGVYLFLGN